MTNSDQLSKSDKMRKSDKLSKNTGQTSEPVPFPSRAAATFSVDLIPKHASSDAVNIVCCQYLCRAVGGTLPHLEPTERLSFDHHIVKTSPDLWLVQGLSMSADTISDSKVKNAMNGALQLADWSHAIDDAADDAHSAMFEFRRTAFKRKETCVDTYSLQDLLDSHVKSLRPTPTRASYWPNMFIQAVEQQFLKAHDSERSGDRDVSALFRECMARRRLALSQAPAIFTTAAPAPARASKRHRSPSPS